MPSDADLGSNEYSLDCICRGAHNYDVLTVVTTEDFAAWFRDLGDRDAEEVATGIELIEALGPERAPPASSDLLLWYHSSSGRGDLDRYYGPDMIEYAQQARRVLTHLSSEPAQRRLTEVSAERAARVAVRMALIGERTRRWRHGLGGESNRSRLELMDDYRAVLEALALSEPKREAPQQTLRELSFSHCEPGMRVLYGVDASNGRALLILGEVLDRRAYGPSVRRALSVWRQFLATDAEQSVVATGSSR
jgi:hypothetical protein